MGTSSMYSGPSRNPLLPSDFDDADHAPKPDQEQNENQDDGVEPDSGQESDNAQGQEIDSTVSSWSSAKTFMSKLSSGSSRNYRGAISKYVKAYGGSRGAANSASSGIRSTTSIGRFISSSDTNGIRDTLSDANIQFEGRSAKEILNDVINYLAPIAITKEDSVARKSIIRTMEELYNRIEDENEDITTLEKIDKELFNIIIPIQIESYIYEKLISDLGSRIETKSTSPAEAVRKEKDLKEYIKSKIDTTLDGQDFSSTDFNSKNIESQIKELYNQCYKVMEDIL